MKLRSEARRDDDPPGDAVLKRPDLGVSGVLPEALVEERPNSRESSVGLPEFVAFHRVDVGIPPLEIAKYDEESYDVEGYVRAPIGSVDELDGVGLPWPRRPPDARAYPESGLAPALDRISERASANCARRVFPPLWVCPWTAAAVRPTSVPPEVSWCAVWASKIRFNVASGSDSLLMTRTSSPSWSLIVIPAAY